MKLKQILLSTLFSLAIASSLSAASPDVKSVTISAFDTMKYSVTRIETHPGQKVVVELKNEGNLPKEAMGHNWILLKLGADPISYASAAIGAKAENYQPKSLADKVLASIPVLGPKESGKVSFTAPSAPGSYAYFCSFPAHCQAGMRGVLVVK
jgi:azurin